MHYYDKKKSKSLTFSEEDKVYLLQKNIKIKQLNKKLDYPKLRLFKMKAIKKPSNYKQELLSQIKIYLVFHIIYLKSANSNTLFKINPPKINLDNQEIEYKVKADLD